MLHLLKRHPVAIEAHFDYTLVLTYALPAEVLKPLLFPGLELDTFGDFGFVAIAMVDVKNLRPKGMPAQFGQNFFLTGYRIFVRYRNAEGRSLRGLRILRSDTDRPLMSVFGNIFTHYNYELASVKRKRSGERLSVKVYTPSGKGNLEVDAAIGDAETDADLPASSPFANLKEARQFEGPLPHTFDYEKETNSIVIVEGVRQDWRPRVISVDVKTADFFRHPPFQHVESRLSSAFYIENVPYWWKVGTIETLAAGNE
ncbi:MAG TPA: DUF2071 domain-containing protein [Candidatus Melainabacteria bacterium]|nr:DUF2071 domain-containing protein [Candidatus Melainabacteria bacterium]